MDLLGKGIVVAGGAGGIGGAVVAALHERGARVAILDADRAHSADADRDGIVRVHADAADDVLVGAALTTLVERLGSISALVNCVGLIHSEPLVNVLRPAARRHRVENWDRIIRSNLTAAFVLGAHFAEYMTANRIKGVIVNFSSVAAAGIAGQTAYSAAKAGVEAMTRVWARELGPIGIRCVAIAPGFVDTAATDAALDGAAIAGWRRDTPLRRLATPAEIAHAVVFALENDFFSGRTLSIDGGLALLG